MRRRAFWLFVIASTMLVTAVVFLRGHGISARRGPLPGEERIAKAAWRYLVPGDARKASNPVANTPKAIEEGLEHFADHCATCHANNGSGNTAIGRNVYPPVPDLRGPRTQSLSDGELFYAIERGIPWTAMPAWGNGTPEGVLGSWELVVFIRHLPTLTPDEVTTMERLNPKSAADIAQDKAIEEFLQGKSSGATVAKEHRHK